MRGRLAPTSGAGRTWTIRVCSISESRWARPWRPPLAAQLAPAGLILRSPFSSLADVGQLHYPLLPVRTLLKDRFAADEQIKRVRCPVLVLAGDRDQIVPLELSRRLYEAVSGPKELVIIPDADHNDLALVTGDTLRDAVVRFLQEGA